MRMKLDATAKGMVTGSLLSKKFEVTGSLLSKKFDVTGTIQVLCDRKLDISGSYL
jgi:hypothetical protein